MAANKTFPAIADVIEEELALVTEVTGMSEDISYPGTPTPEWDEVRRLTAEWLKEQQQKTVEATSDD